MAVDMGNKKGNVKCHEITQRVIYIGNAQRLRLFIRIFLYGRKF